MAYSSSKTRQVNYPGRECHSPLVRWSLLTVVCYGQTSDKSTTPVGSVIVRSFGQVNYPGRECHSPLVRWSLLAVVCYGQTSGKSTTPVGSVIVRSFGGHSLPSRALGKQPNLSHGCTPEQVGSGHGHRTPSRRKSSRTGPSSQVASKPKHLHCHGKHP